MSKKDRKEGANLAALVKFQPKSLWQKDNCINCTSKAVLEAVLGSKNFMAQIRCCEKPACKKFAAEIAVLSAQAFGLS